MRTRWSVAMTAVVVGLFGFSGVAPAQTEETVIPDFIATCTSTGELCEPPYTLSVDTGSVLQVQYTVRSTHCGSVRVHLFVDGVFQETTDFLGWPGAPFPFSDLALDTGLVDLGPVAPGTHVVGIQAEGQVGGCNSGQLDSWGGSLTVVTSPPVIPAQIDVKPGSFPNSINPGSRGVIPVAILTNDTFDATTANPTTLRFGPAGTEAAPVHSALADVDGDGDIDLILQFDTGATGIRCGDASVVLKGQTFGGQPLEGSDSIHTVPCK